MRRSSSFKVTQALHSYQLRKNIYNKNGNNPALATNLGLVEAVHCSSDKKVSPSSIPLKARTYSSDNGKCSPYVICAQCNFSLVKRWLCPLQSQKGDAGIVAGIVAHQRDHTSFCQLSLSGTPVMKLVHLKSLCSQQYLQAANQSQKQRFRRQKPNHATPAPVC